MVDKVLLDLEDGGVVETGDQTYIVRGPDSMRATLGDAAGRNVGTGANSVAAYGAGGTLTVANSVANTDAVNKQQLDFFFGELDNRIDLTESDIDALQTWQGTANTKINNLESTTGGYGNVVTRNTGTSANQVPILDGSGKLVIGVIPTNGVQSVGLTVPTGFSVANTPVTSSGTLAITYTAGYQGYTTAESNKLANVATGATANLPDANLLSRANHTGTQPANTITGLGALATKSTVGITDLAATGAPSGTTALYGDNTWKTVPAGTVISVAMSVPTGFSVANSPVTTSGTLAVTYAAGYQGYTTTEANKLANVATGADVTNTAINAAATKATPVDADTVVITDSAASNALKRVTWANIKATLKTYFDSLYVLAVASASDVLTGTDTSKYMVSKNTYDALAPVGLTDGGTISINMNDGVNFTVTLGGNRTLANPTNAKPGQTGSITVSRAGTQTLSFANNWIGYGTVALPTTSAKGFKVLYEVQTSSSVHFSISPQV